MINQITRRLAASLRRAPAVVAVVASVVILGASAPARADFLISNFNGGNFNYFYGGTNTWDDAGANAQGATTFSLLPAVATEFGGAGFFYGASGPNLSGDATLNLTGRLIAGNSAGSLQFNFSGNGGSGSSTVFIPLSGFNTNTFTTVSVPLTNALNLTNLQQIQVQGINFSGSAQPLGFEFDNLQTVAAVTVPEPGTLALIGVPLGVVLVARRRKR